MSDPAGAAPGSGASAVPETAGAWLRRAREDAGLHIGALAVSLKVPVRKLEALESDRLDLLPDAVFARALAASVCRTLKLDAEPVLRLLPEQNKPRLQIDSRLAHAASFETPGMGSRLPLLSRLPRPVLAIAGLLLLAAAALLLFPVLEPGEPPAAPATQGSAAVEPATTMAPAEPRVAEPAAGGAQAANAANPAVTAPVASAPIAAAPVAVPASAPTAAADTATKPGVGQDAAPAAGLVVFKTRGTSWVEVTDAAGVVQLRKTMAGGETAAASGAVPLSVVVGRVDSTEVVVRGKILELGPLAKDNVARFQVK